MFSRHWTESVLSIFAIIIAAISLWIAIDTERTNRQLVAEAAWPFLQTYHSTFAEGQQAISLYIANAGVGPAKVETLEVFWNGKPYGSSAELMKACCGLGGPATCLILERRPKWLTDCTPATLQARYSGRGTQFK